MLLKPLPQAVLTSCRFFSFDISRRGQLCTTAAWQAAHDEQVQPLFRSQHVPASVDVEVSLVFTPSPVSWRKGLVTETYTGMVRGCLRHSGAETEAWHDGVDAACLYALSSSLMASSVTARLWLEHEHSQHPWLRSGRFSPQPEVEQAVASCLGPKIGRLGRVTNMVRLPDSPARVSLVAGTVYHLSRRFDNYHPTVPGREACPARTGAPFRNPRIAS